LKLRQQFIIITLLAFAVSAILGGAIFYTDELVNQAISRKNSIDEIVQSIIELERLSFSYFTHPTEQTASEWYTENSQIYLLLNTQGDPDPRSAPVLQRLSLSQKNIEATFARLKQANRNTAQNLNITDLQDRNLFIDELSTELQSMEKDSSELASYSQNDIFNTQKNANLLSLEFIILLLATILVSTSTINNRIIKPITQITKTASEITHGNLASKPKIFTGKNEISVLGQAIGEMAEYLIEINRNLEKRVTELNETQSALLKSESRLRSLLTANPDMIFITDPNGKYLEIFTGRDDLLALPREILIGKTIAELLPNPLGAEMTSVIHRAGETHEIQEYEYQLPTPAGQRWFKARVMTYDVQDTSYVMWLAQDITLGKEAELMQERRREMLEVVIELGKAATRISNLNECLQTINQSVRNGLGFDRVGIFLYEEKTGILQGAYGTDRTGKMEDTSWFIQSVKEFKAWQTVLSSPKGFVFVDNYKSIHELPQNNEMAEVSQHITVSAWAGEKPVAVISVDNGITQRRILDEQAEALRLYAGYAGLAIENARFNAVLEQRVSDRTSELQETLQELENFSYTISHDLRAPLRGVSGFAHLLEADYGHDLPAQALHHVDRIKESARTMGELIDGLLTFTRLGRQSINKKNIDMEILAQYSLRNIQKKISFDLSNVTIGSLHKCLADPIMAQIVLEHLISNAVKFTRNRRPARIEVRSQIKDGKTIYSIKDNGVGFDMKYVHKLFGVFQRLHAQDEFEGTGVGLAIVQRIIHKHGGRIWAESEVNKGATFYFSLE